MDRATILVVDDDELTRELLAIVFESDGHRAVCVPSVSEALLHLIEADAIVLDIMMPRQSGIDLLEILPEDHPPVVVLTALSDDVTRNTSLECGAAAVIKKPFVVVELMRAVRRVLEESQSRQWRANTEGT